MRLLSGFATLALGLGACSVDSADVATTQKAASSSCDDLTSWVGNDWRLSFSAGEVIEHQGDRYQANVDISYPNAECAPDDPVSWCADWFTLLGACGVDDPASCDDGIQNQDETGVDCGGVCEACPVTETCDDGIQNQNETGVDCGGVCDACPVTETCDDGIQNQDETGVDCGGSCEACETSGGVVVPAKIEAEDFVRYEDSTSTHSGDCGSGPVDQQTTTDAGGGCFVGWTTAGEWLEYDIVVGDAGSFDISLRLASKIAGKQVQVSVDGSVVGTVTAPSAGWQAFEALTLGDVPLSAGSHTVRLTFLNGSVNLNWLALSSGEGASCSDGIQNQDETGVDCGGSCAACPVEEPSEWAQKIQLYGHGYSVPNQFTDEELEWIANTFKVFTVEKRHAYGTYGSPSTERATIDTAAKLKAINPDIKVLMYWNEILTYSGLYETSSAVVDDNPSWLGADWTNVNGATWTTWDLSVPGAQDFWVDAISSTIEGGLDGVFLDAGPKTHVRGQSAEASMLVDRIRTRVGQDKTVIFNGYRTNGASSMQAGPERIETASGVYVEFFLRTPCDTKEEAAYLFDNLIDAQEDGKFVGARSSSKHGLPGAADPFLFNFASFLLVYGPNSYWFYNDSYDKADWLYDYRPEYYDIATGTSLGSAVRDGWVYTREFENISVRVDLENVTASITQK